MTMTRKEKHLSVLSMYLAKLERNYDNGFMKLQENEEVDKMRDLVELYNKIEDVKKEIEKLKYN